MPTLVLLVFVALAGTAQAAESGIYLGAGISQAQIDGIAEDFTVEDLDDWDFEDTAWKLIVGYRLHDLFAIEVNYMDLGEDSVVLGAASAEANIAALGAYAVGLLPVRAFDLYAKLGISRWELDGSFRGVTFGDLNEEGTEFAYGFGAQARLGSLATRLEYDQFDIGRADGLELLTLGVTWRF